MWIVTKENNEMDAFMNKTDAISFAEKETNVLSGNWVKREGSTKYGEYISMTLMEGKTPVDCADWDIVEI